jgi:hypothetical protein
VCTSAADRVAHVFTPVDHRDQLASGNLRVFLCMEAPEVADADNCRLDFVHALLCARFPAGRRDYGGLGKSCSPGSSEHATTTSRLSRPKFEAMTFGLAFLAGLLVMPALVYLAGRYTLGPYAHGTVQETHGVLSLFADFFKGLPNPGRVAGSSCSDPSPSSHSCGYVASSCARYK